MKIFKQNPDMSLTDITIRSKMFNIFSILLITAIIAMSMTPVKQDVVKIVKQIDTVYLQDTDIPLTDSAILSELVKNDCILSPVAIAQMKIETGNFTSAICKENKNLFGIRTSNSDHVLKVNNIPVKNRGHNAYASYKNCIKDYIRIQKRYLKNIDGKYAQSEFYIETLKKVK